LFESLIDSCHETRRFRQPLAFCVALILHASALAIVLAVNHFAVPPAGEPPVQVSFLEFAPPPAPAAPASQAASQAPVSPPAEDPAVEPPHTEIVQPQVTPEPIQVERIAEVSSPSADDATAAGTPDGVTGGVADGEVGGIPGGVLGGVPGGVPGGTLGGVLGGPLTVGGDVSAPVVISRVRPVYPARARNARVEGSVKLEAVIHRDGSVGDVRVIQGLRMGCTEAAIEALKHWRFRPGERNGVPVDVYFELTVDFIQAP